MKRLNETLLERRVDAQYVTLLLMYWNKQRKQLILTNAGSLPPLVCRGGDRIRITAEGVPLGLLEDREYDEVSVPLEKGDVIVLYSDGVQDQLNHAGQEYGTSRLFKAVKMHCSREPAEIVSAVFHDLDSHAEGGLMNDDQSLIAMKVQ
jgi:sigma-B regulation protein RsbU (phosphoserine phosphatase)